MKHRIAPSQEGVAHLWLIIAMVVVVIGFVGFQVLKQTRLVGENWTRGCTSKDRVQLTHLPMDQEDVQTITPYGLTAGAHVTPIDHLYFYPKATERDASPVYAMADGFIQEIQTRSQSTDSGAAKPTEYRIVMQHSCKTISYFDLVTSLNPEIEKQWKGLHLGLHIPIKAGQEIGRIGGQSLDTAVYNMDLILPGFIHPDLYSAEGWKIHTDDFFSYFPQTLQDQMQVLNIRKVKPYSGKIDYDQPGKLIGNWFLEGTGGYGGSENSDGVGKDGHGYWDGHLAIFYHATDGKTVTVSVGQFGPDRQPQAFAVKGNQPDPAQVDQATGVVKYELIPEPRFDPTGQMRDQENHHVQIMGVVLFEVLGGEKLKVEFFAGKTAAEVTGFTSAALTYLR